MKTLVSVFLMATLVVLAGPAQRAEACSCAMVDPAAMLAEADAAFVGTLIERPAEPNAPDQFEGVYVFEVEEWVKGDLGPQVGVLSALDGAACGLEMSEGERAGIFLYNSNGRPSSDLCSTTSPEALLAADKPLAFDGTGPPVFLVAAETGRTRLATLDASGRLLAAAGDDRFGWSVSVCPDEELLVEAVEGEVTVREVDGLEALRTADPPAAGRAEQVWCLDREGERILAQVWDESGGAPRLLILGEEVLIHRGDTYHVDVGTDHVAVIAASGATLEIIPIGGGETRQIPVSGEVSHASFSPDGDRLLVNINRFRPAGDGWDALITVYDAASGEPVWEGDPMPDLEVYGWMDDSRIAAGFYPVEADAPRNIAIDTADSSVTDIPLPGWNLKSVGSSVVSVDQGRLLVIDAAGKVSPLTSFPTPAHRLVAVLAHDVEPRPNATTTTATSNPTPTSVPRAAEEASDTADWPVAATIAAGVLVALLAAAIVVRRRSDS